MKQTAVEWFEQQLDNLDIEIPFSIYEEAKEIEKEQTIEFTDWVNLNAYKYTTNTTTTKLLEIFKNK